MSTPPTPYNRSYNFEDFQSINPNSPLPAQHLENELNNIEETLDKTVSRLAEIQNPDGSIKITGNIEQNITNTATSVATSVANQVSSDYLAANFDATAATTATTAAQAAASSATQSASSAHLAGVHANYAGQTTLIAQNAASQAASHRNSAEDFADQANLSKIAAHGSAQSASASAAEVGNVYNSALSLKNWVDSQSYQFVHKREETTHIAANMLFNDGDADNTLIGKIFQGAEMDSNSKVTYPGPINNSGYNFVKGPWWVVGNPSPENPEKIIMRDMMNCLVHTWLAFGPSVASGEMKPMQPGVNGQPNDNCKSYDFTGKLIKPVIYTQQDFNTQINSPISKDSALTPKGYVDQKIALVTSMAQQADSTATVAREEVQQFRTQEYDNGRVYGPHEIVKFGNKLYWFNDFIGAAGYAPNTHPSAWTELSGGGSVDLTGYATENFVTSQGYLTSVPSGYATESFVTSQGYLTSVPAGYATENFVTSQGYLTSVPSSYVQLNASNGINVGGKVEANSGFVSDKSYSYPVNFDTGTPGRTGSTAFSIVNNNVGSDLSLYMQRFDTVTALDSVNIPLPSHQESSSLSVRADVISGVISSTAGDGTSSSFSIHKGGISCGEQEGLVSKGATFGPNGFSFDNGQGYSVVFDILGLRFADGTRQTTAFNSSSFMPTTGGTFTGKVNFTPGTNTSGINIGIGGNETGTNSGDIWIPSGSSVLNYRDGSGTWRNCLANNLPNTIDISTATSPALRVTQRGGAPAIVVEDDVNPDGTSFFVNASGNVGVGLPTSQGLLAKLEVEQSAAGSGIGTAVFRMREGVGYGMSCVRVENRSTNANSFVVEDAANPDSTSFIIDSSGNVALGYPSNSGTTLTQKLEVFGNTRSTTFSTLNNGQFGPTFSVNSVSTHSGGANTHDIFMSIGGSTYRIPAIFVSTP